MTLDLLVKFSKPSRRVTLFHHLMNRIYKRISKSKEPVIEEKNMNFFYKKIALSKGCFMFLKKKRKKERMFYEHWTVITSKKKKKNVDRAQMKRIEWSELCGRPN